MSFDWSAGDIATAISLLHNLINALDSCYGAASDYREAVGFLYDLNRSLELLWTFAAWNAYPAYDDAIREQVLHIRLPVEQFLEAVLKYEPSLGAKASIGRHRHVSQQKIKWHVQVSSKAVSLRKIKSHLKIVDTLMQRLNLYGLLSPLLQIAY